MKLKKNNEELLFLKSALTEENRFISTDGVKQWLQKKKNSVNIKIEKIKFSDMDQWYIDPENGNIRHKSGKFFSIVGIQVKTNWGDVNEWTQPIINQPEIGVLGIITKEIDGILYFLMQAKIEPGNVNHIQISPTLQATKSNYTQVHQGKKPLYLKYFQNRNKIKVLIDQLQSEQGARFLKKRNRNIIIQVEEDIPVYEDFCWLTLGQIKKLIQIDNTVNMDTRTVISGIPFGKYQPDVIDFYNAKNYYEDLEKLQKDILKSPLDIENSLYSFDDILSLFTQSKIKYDLDIEKIPLCNVNKWIKTDYDIHHQENKYFKVIAVEAEIGSREVKRWTQPLLEPTQEGLCAFIVKKINSIYHFLVQTKVECGDFDILEFAPTVQCLTGNYRATEKGTLPFLEYVLNAKSNQIKYDTLQSEEGGRFFKEQNRNLIIEADENFIEEIPENYIWMTLHQLDTFLKFNNYLNIQARSLISSINFI